MTTLPDGPGVARDLLAWYGQNARDLPWRIGPGKAERPDPYRVWLSEVMLQQTTVAAVRGYFTRFLALWPDIHSLAAASDDEVMAEWAGLGYYARARNLIACARQVSASGGFPSTRDGLRALPGIGDYTSAAIAAIAYDHPETVVDANVERVTSRLFAIEEPLPRSRKQIRDAAQLLTPHHRPGDFAQAMMDLGATLCTPRNPSCALCPINRHCCAYQQGIADVLPVRAPRRQKPHRKGTVWILSNPHGDVLVERRPAKGLLGGMLAFPSSDWDGNTATAPADLSWQNAGQINHVFTHFSLDMTVLLASGRVNPTRGSWLSREAFSPDSLPTLFRKAWVLANS